MTMVISLYIVIFLLVWTAYVWFKHKRERLPPGPMPLPLVGNILQLPRKAPWETMKDWANQYGPIMTMKFGLRTAIVLNTREAARVLLEKRSNISSDRPRLIAFSEYTFKGLLPLSMKYGQEWLDIHRLQLRMLNPKASRGSTHIERLAIDRFMWEMLGGGDITDRIQWLTMHSTSALILGNPIGTVTYEDTRRQRSVFQLSIASLSIETVLVDLFPFLEYIPGVRSAGMRKATRNLNTVSELMDDKLNAAVSSPAWNMTQALYRNKPQAMSWEGFRMAVVEMYLASNAGTPTTMGVIALMAALHPHEVRKVQEEIDRVVGTDRQPTIDDWDHLPRVHALIAECLRYKTIAPISLPHAVTEETEFMGYRIPPDALILANQWAYNHDEDTYGDPQNFRPQRWIDTPDLPQPNTFGFGRRMCPGRHTVSRLMFVTIASMLWGYDLDVKEGVTEKPVKGLSIVFQGDTSGVTYACRSEKHRSVIERDWNAVNPDVSGLLNDLGEALGL